MSDLSFVLWEKPRQLRLLIAPWPHHMLPDDDPCCVLVLRKEYWDPESEEWHTDEAMPLSEDQLSAAMTGFQVYREMNPSLPHPVDIQRCATVIRSWGGPS